MGDIIGIIGAGGKMGRRIVNNLLGEYELIGCEKNDTAKKELKEDGVTVKDIIPAVKQSDIVVMAVPDASIKDISQNIVPEAEKDTTFILLDPAAAYAGELTLREDCTFIVTHPCHPQLFKEQETEAARKDFFGGIDAVQDIVIALLEGKRENLKKAKEVCIDMFAPVENCYEITVEQMALLEPAAAEVVAAACASIMKEAYDEVIKRGVPREAARSFLLGHIQIPLAIVFDEIDSPFSDGAKVAIKEGHNRIFKDEWKEVFEPEVVKKTIQNMLNPESK
ncbi:MAG: phosphogluconate dehydrogenase C-terminal domain-containing protein [Bacillota bacterium]